MHRWGLPRDRLTAYHHLRRLAQIWLVLGLLSIVSALYGVLGTEGLQRLPYVVQFPFLFTVTTVAFLTSRWRACCVRNDAYIRFGLWFRRAVLKQRARGPLEPPQ